MASMDLCTAQEDGCFPTDGVLGEAEAQAMDEFSVQRKGDRLPFQIFPDPVEVVLGPEGTLTCVQQGKERLPSIVVEPTDVSEVESGELRWPPEDMDFDEDEDLFLEQCIPPANISDWGEEEEETSVIENHQQNTSLLAIMEDGDIFDFDFDFNESDCGIGNCSVIPDPIEEQFSSISIRHWVALICYSIVFLLGVPGNGLVVWVTAFRMPNSVNAQWFLNLAIADLLCCLSLPLLMVPLAQDQHWSFGPLACKFLHGLFYMVMYCSVLLLVMISLDRFLLVTKPVWCQNWRNVKLVRCACLTVWLLALFVSVPQFVHMQEKVESETKTLCVSSHHTISEAWAVTLSRFILSFVLPFLVICVSHWKVYQVTRYGQGQRVNDKSARTLRVILALVFSFFLCWIPLHIVDFLLLIIRKKSQQLRANLNLAHVLALCLAYINSCLNPLLYVCLGRGFKKNLISSLRSVLHYASEAPPSRFTMTSMTASSKTTTDSNTCRDKPL